MNRKFFAVPAAGLLAAGMFTGCSGGDRYADPPAPVDTSVSVPSMSVTDGPTVMSIGDVYVFPDGVGVIVEQLPDGVIPAGYPLVSPAPGTAYPVYRYTITNGTDQPFDPTEALISLNYGPDGTAAQMMYVADSEITSSYWQGAILPGQEQSLVVAYEMPVGQDVTITFAPDFDHRPVIFTNLPQ